MINFRYHLVSLTAVFLALAAGITIGAGVVDRATVDRIEGQLREVASRREATNAENDRLKQDLGRWGGFSEELGDRAVEGRLAGVTVFVVGTKGISRQAVEGLRSSMSSAGAEIDGTLWFTGKWTLVRQEDAVDLAAVLDVAPTTEREDLRAAGLAAIGTAWAVGDNGPLVTALVDRGFLEFEAGASVAVPLAELPRQGSLFVVVSGDDADVAPGDLAHPLVARLAGSSVKVLAAQPQRPAPPTAKEGERPPPEFVFALRSDSSVATRISTVDNIDDFRGRVAAVLALRELHGGKTGHYGFGPDVRRLPDPAP
jgi:hypothetical protein